MDPIKHVVLLMLENHSFDQMLGCMQEVYPTLDGIAPGAPRTNPGPGRSYAQEAVESAQVKPDPKHEHENVKRQIAGENSGFIRDYFASYKEVDARAGAANVMGYFPRGFLYGLHPLAESFTVCDHWFSSLPGPTWPNRFFALSGTSNGRVLMPDGIAHLSMLWSQTQDTIFDRLNEKARSWRVYFYDFPTSLLLRNQRRTENLRNYHSVDQLFRDVAREDADETFPDFALIEPKYMGLDQNDDHPPHNVTKAQKLIADVYNGIRSNDALWASTLLIVVYDEHGGFYDHVTPPRAVPPDDHAEEYAFDQLGVRVPAVLVSPWLEARVETARFDHTSVLRYLIEKWDLGRLGHRAEAENSIALAFREMREPRTDTPAFLRVPASKLIAPEPDWERQDMTTHHDGLHLLADVLDAPDEALTEAVEKAAEAAAAWRKGLESAKAAVGERLIAWGKALRRPLEIAQKERLGRTAALAHGKIQDAKKKNEK